MPAGPSTPALALRHVTKVFEDGTRALEDVSFTVDPGELVSLVGPSGCGKTTALRIAAGLETPTDGDVERSAAASANLGFVFQDATLLEWRTARSNVELLPELRGVPAAERRARAEAALASVGLSDAGAKRPRQLSGGMRMRVSIARALVSEPELALFDEPFGALDELTRLSLQVLLQDLFAAARFAALFITHSVAEAVYLSDRVLVMGPGRIADEVVVPWAHPRAPELRYTAEFAALVGEVSGRLESAGASIGDDPRAGVTR
ncbi:MAG: ABC transporter ATP-binding protein [Salana multivorans]|uniref:ABC transporter ATP-binding protein n=1 Tax=Salana multivorans TaxID=120377 RepID=UPI0009646B7B|nr:ABC transporter ATP-binding protein [Salana multivorans]MBN8881612.1 ABC transporter ATP-binding protein [Salana multivorans]OJX97001.1 MAG: ABC transporter ATP-binding protein [Micrococcales bacterium 73-15]